MNRRLLVQRGSIVGILALSTGAMAVVACADPDANLIATCERFIELAGGMYYCDNRLSDPEIQEWTRLGRTIPRMEARTTLGAYWKLRAFMEGAVDNIEGQDDLAVVTSAMNDLARIAGVPA
jgi:hypothetical protein